MYIQNETKVTQAAQDTWSNMIEYNLIYNVTYYKVFKAKNTYNFLFLKVKMYQETD